MGVVVISPTVYSTSQKSARPKSALRRGKRDCDSIGDKAAGERRKTVDRQDLDMTEGEYLDFGQEGNNTKSSSNTNTTMIDVESISYDNFPDPDDIANSKCNTKLFFLVSSFVSLDYYALDITLHIV